MTTTRLKGGRVYDPLNGIDGKVLDLWISDGRIVAPPADGRADEVIDLSGKVVMPGGIDLHSHIGGGKVNIARMMLPEEHRAHLQHRHGACRSGSGHASPSTFSTGYAYARMGYTMAFEPAMLAANARQAHQEMADIPLLDKGAYVLLGSDDLLLGLIKDGAGQDAIRDYVAWTFQAAQALAIKIVNPGGISAFKFNGRRMDLDTEGPFYGITPRTILTTLADAVTELGVPHPIHVHGCNLGVPGADATTLATIQGMEGRRIHLTHLHFHSYGKEGKAGFSSGAGPIAELINRSPNVSCDIGQVMFGQTVTASGDTMSQVRNARFASPEEVGRHGHRVRGRLRRAPVPVPRPEPGQRAAMVRRARAVPPDRGPLAGVPDHRPPQRCPLHHLPASDPAAHGQELPPGHAGHHP